MKVIGFSHSLRYDERQLDYIMAIAMAEQRNYIYGIHAVKAYQARPELLESLYVIKSKSANEFNDIIQFARTQGIHVAFCDKAALDKMTHQANHQGIAALTRTPKAQTEADLIDIVTNKSGQPLLLILDGVQDPHNLGACLRTAECAGVDAVIVPKDKAVGLTPTVVKVAAGAALRVPLIQVNNIARCIKTIQELGVWVYGTDDEAEQSLYQTDLKGAVAIVMGAEDRGLRRLTRDLCDYSVNIPMQGEVSSLNVSVATGVSLFEVLRQRLS